MCVRQNILHCRLPCYVPWSPLWWPTSPQKVPL